MSAPSQHSFLVAICALVVKCIVQLHVCQYISISSVSQLLVAVIWHGIVMISCHLAVTNVLFRTDANFLHSLHCPQFGDHALSLCQADNGAVNNYFYFHAARWSSLHLHPGAIFHPAVLNPNRPHCGFCGCTSVTLAVFCLVPALNSNMKRCRKTETDVIVSQHIRTDVVL